MAEQFNLDQRDDVLAAVEYLLDRIGKPVTVSAANSPSGQTFETSPGNITIWADRGRYGLAIGPTSGVQFSVTGVIRIDDTPKEDKPMPKTYGWLITEDVYDPGSTRRICGPRNIDPDILSRLENGEGKRFRLRDGDGDLDYEGLMVLAPEDDGSEIMFAPLDWAASDTGSTSIEYLNEETGAWEEL